MSVFPPIWLSPTTLNMVRDCPRCLWDHLLWKQKRPHGPFPTLPRGVDEAMKRYCDQHRGTLPPALKAASALCPTLLDYSLHNDQRWINTLREWRGGISTTIRLDGQIYKLVGSVDDLLIRDSDGAIAQIDGKSKGKAPEPGEGEKYYGAQMDAYDLIFRENGFIPAGEAFLWYVIPVSFEDRNVVNTPNPSANIIFDQTIQRMESNADRAMEQIIAIHKLLVDHPDRTKPPVSGGTCEYCSFAGRG